MIRSFSEVPFAVKVIESFLELENSFQLKVWFGRVPTASNIADGPSRLDFQALLDCGAERKPTPTRLDPVSSRGGVVQTA